MATSFALGHAALLDRLKTIKFEIVRKGARTAAGQAMRPVREQAKRDWQAIDDPETGAHIAKQVALSTRYDPKRGEVKARVGIRGGARAEKGDPLNTGHWRFVELGTSEIAARPIMRQALEANISKITATFFDGLQVQIDKALAKAGGPV